MVDYYGTVDDGDDYFETRLHSDVWDNSSLSDKIKALYTATRYIDRLNYKGQKHTVYILVDATNEEIRAAEASQVLEFPRDDDTDIPGDIEIACYEIAFALLDGVDPDIELEALGVQAQSYAGVRTTFNRDQQPIEHLIHGIASAFAWRLLKPFLRDGKAVKFDRVS